MSQFLEECGCMNLNLAYTKHLLEPSDFCQESISEESVRRFCKECANIRVVRSGSSIAAAEFEGKSPHREILIEDQWTRYLDRIIPCYNKSCFLAINWSQ